MSKIKAWSGHVLMWFRPFHVVYLGVVFLLALSWKGVESIGFSDLKVYLVGVLDLPLIFLINDYIHRRKDALVRERRLLSSHQGMPGPLLAFLIFLFVFCATLAASLSWTTLAIYLSLFLAAWVYGLAKHHERMPVAYGARAFCGSAHFLLFVSAFGLARSDIPIAVVLGIFDLQTNIAGDVRDYYLDRRSGVRTLPQRWGFGATAFVLVLLQLYCWLALARYLGLAGQAWHLTASLSFLLAWLTFLFILSQGEKYIQWAHASMHGFKILLVASAAALLSGSSLSRLSVILASALLLWLMAYLAYLWGDHRLLACQNPVPSLS